MVCMCHQAALETPMEFPGGRRWGPGPPLQSEGDGGDSDDGSSHGDSNMDVGGEELPLEGADEVLQDELGKAEEGPAGGGGAEVRVAPINIC